MTAPMSASLAVGSALNVLTITFVFESLLCLASDELGGKVGDEVKI